MPTSAQIRQQFLDFFIQKHGHTFVPSSPVVPLDDPTLLFTNAGMNQFKPIFLGLEKRPYTRAVNTQKCIRAGGKHNDLDDVGRSRRHHTFFEMLGNWSFGDYFKRGAIGMSWELLTKEWKLDPGRLHVSVYEGDEKAGIPRDTEAAELWKEIANWEQFGLKSDDHIHFLGKENFWEMGDTGPCGPCTEIFIDRRPDAERAIKPDLNADDPRVMEFWNNVFIQYDRDATGRLTPLPAQHVDTGMGLGRICQILQGKDDNYATDLWAPLFEKIRDLSGISYTGKFPKTNAADPQAESADEQLRHDIAMRVVADHAKCLTFALTDGAVASNEGRGYVLRRILRRAVRFGRQQLGLNEPFMHQLAPIVVESMGGAFPELKKNPKHVVDLIKDEENNFGRTLDRGIQLFAAAENDAVSKFMMDRSNPERNEADDFVSSEFARTNAPEIQHKDGSSTISLEYVNWGNWKGRLRPTISASDAFKLHDTYGFPIDLTRIMAEERGMTVDIAGYEKLMEQAREIARSGGKADDSKKLTDLPPAALAQLQRENIKPTDDSPKYSRDPIAARIMAIWNGDDLGLSPAAAAEDEALAIILDRTNFYAEMGGQVGDAGTLTGPTSLDLGEPAQTAGATIFDVQTTKAVGGYILHIGRLRSGRLGVGESVTAAVAPQRQRTEQNHTGTHLANWALREVLGDGVQQKGSLVDPEKLRFDFTHGKAMTDDEIARVEALVNEQISRELPVYIDVAPQEQALKISGLRAVFGEKYPPRVRVVSIGAPVQDMLADPTNPKWRSFSVEFCGGTHLNRSDEIGGFAITSEESVSKGIRRIVALTNESAEQVRAADEKLEAEIAKAKDAADSALAPLIAQLQKEITGQISLRAKRRAQQTISELQTRHRAHEKSAKASAGQGSDIDAIAAAAALLAEAPALGPGKLIVGEIRGATDDQLRSAVDSLRKKSPSHAILLASALEEKITFVAAVSEDLIAMGLRAGDWVKQTAALTGGGGGGRPQMAQGSGKDPGKLNQALDAAKAYAREKSQTNPR